MSEAPNKQEEKAEVEVFVVDTDALEVLTKKATPSDTEGFWNVEGLGCSPETSIHKTRESAVASLKETIEAKIAWLKEKLAGIK